ncbi:dicarboxylate/amino acid:cation symporter [Butyrivibrio sp. VCD2006]|uniref:dicarboxylate/amino acid:cation symporter n=1 Tax=Butyrivibrio sp. VCD2006 TaxID=1280664 RepID=UPI00040822AA|nr:dicarboxylate/amino acid:cation symporter [Butyrivibrio sp. VCD2006]
MSGLVTTIVADSANLKEGMEFIENGLKKYNVKGKDKAKAMLLSEEYLVKIIRGTQNSGNISIGVKKSIGKTTITIMAKGQNIIQEDTPEDIIDFYGVESAPNAEAVIRNMIINANRDILRRSYRNSTNKGVITAGVSSQKNLIYVLTSMVMAAVICTLMRLILPENINMAVNDYVFVTIKTIFLNALKAIIAPLIFFSIAASVSSTTDITEIGKLGGKVISFYGMTTLAATIIAYFSFNLVSPGVFNELAYLVKGTETATQGEMVSILDTLIDIVPDNFFGAFVNSATLQLIFLAILIGGVVPFMGERTEKIASFIASANELFLRGASVITKCLPIAVFAFIGSMVLTMDVKVISTMVSLFISLLLGLVIMMVFYMTVVMILTKSNPIRFLKEAIPAWLNAFALSSSSAAMAFTMQTCDKKLKISPRLYSFSIPLGATINMDGFVIVLTISFLFLAKVFGVTLSTGDISALIVTIVLLSFGAPGIPGVSTICMSVLLMQFNVPMEALALFIGIDAITDPLNTANNVFGDIVGTYCIAKRNNMMQE